MDTFLYGVIMIFVGFSVAASLFLSDYVSAIAVGAFGVAVAIQAVRTEIKNK